MQRDSGDLFNVCLAAHVKRVVVTVSRIVYMAKLLRHHVFVLELFVAFEDRPKILTTYTHPQFFSDDFFLHVDYEILTNVYLKRLPKTSTPNFSDNLVMSATIF